MKAILLLILVLVAAPVFAQALPVDRFTPSLPSIAEQRTANTISNLTVASSLALDTWSSWHSPDRRRAFLFEGIRYTVVVSSFSITKRLIHRLRPDASDTQSFFSGHTATAAASFGGPRFIVSVPLAVSTAGLRIAANKHYLTDTLVGGLVGTLAGRYLRE